uniref:Syndetin isoform X2 n=1 Tax=Rhizophora mucronata TaxID=61149 RepID=A0A2P2L7M2_RHIMU
MLVNPLHDEVQLILEACPQELVSFWHKNLQ